MSSTNRGIRLEWHRVLLLFLWRWLVFLVFLCVFFWVVPGWGVCWCFNWFCSWLLWWWRCCFFVDDCCYTLNWGLFLRSWFPGRFRGVAVRICRIRVLVVWCRTVRWVRSGVRGCLWGRGWGGWRWRTGLFIFLLWLLFCLAGATVFAGSFGWWGRVCVWLGLVAFWRRECLGWWRGSDWWECWLSGTSSSFGWGLRRFRWCCRWVLFWTGSSWYLFFGRVVFFFRSCWWCGGGRGSCSTVRWWVVRVVVLVGIVY